MDYCLFRLRFKTALHIGGDSGMPSMAACEISIHSDTVFSALCHEALQMGGHEMLDRLVSYAGEGSLLMSDALPFRDEELYLPKPAISPAIPPGGKKTWRQDDAKALKKLKFIHASMFEEYLGFIRGENEFPVSSANASFGVKETRTMAFVRRSDKTLPFHVGVFSFFPGSGLYIVAGYNSRQAILLLASLLNSLSVSGIGGKRTAGLGRFEIERTLLLETASSKSEAALAKLLAVSCPDYYMTLNASFPEEPELEVTVSGGFFQVVRRGGFVQSHAYADKPLKKRVMYFMAAGSCFKNRFNGGIYDVSLKGVHPVYRYAKPLFAGVKL